MSISPSTIARDNLLDNVRFLEDVLFMNNSDNWNITIDGPIHAKGISDTSFVSEKKKVVIKILPSFFHLYVEQFATLLFINSFYKDFEVVVVDARDDEKFGKSDDLNKSVDMLFLFLQDNALKYTVIHISEIYNIPINNYFFCDSFIDDSRNQAMVLSNMSHKYVIDKEIQNKVYIRSNRVLNEEILEKYLSNYGFTILEKNSFDNFIDQMVYFYNSKTVISATCGGLVNICFMKESSTVLELVTPVKQFDLNNSRPGSGYYYDIHHIYNTLCFQKNIFYSSITNYKKDAYDIINKIENSQTIKKILEA